jgi:hypothetical protein
VPVNTGDFHLSKAIVLVLYWVKADNNRWDFSLSQYQALEPKEENRMEITIYRRHSASCPQKAYRYAPRCGCPLSGQFNWTRSATNLDGKKLKHEQNKWSLNARLWSEAQQNATKLKNDLEEVLVPDLAFWLDRAHSNEQNSSACALPESVPPRLSAGQNVKAPTKTRRNNVGSQGVESNEYPHKIDLCTINYPFAVAVWHFGSGK